MNYHWLQFDREKLSLANPYYESRSTDGVTMRSKASPADVPTGVCVGIDGSISNWKTMVLRLSYWDAEELVTQDGTNGITWQFGVQSGRLFEVSIPRQLVERVLSELVANLPKIAARKDDEVFRRNIGITARAIEAHRESILQAI